MSNFVCLVRAEDSEGCDQIFTLPDCTYAPEAGDLVEHDGEFFPVTEVFFIIPDSPEYRTINALCQIYAADAVYQRRWNKESNA